MEGLAIPARPGRRARWLEAAARLDAAALAAWGVVALSALACVTMLTWPLGYDQGVFMTVGDTVARGGRPYADAWDVKGPLEFYLMAGLQLVFGRHAWGLRLFDVALAALTAWMLWRALRPRTSARVAALGAASYPLLVAGLGFEASAQFELWVGTAMLGICLLLTRRAEAGGYRLWELAAAGALVGLATLVKPVFPVLLAVPGVAVLFRHWGRPALVVRDGVLLALAFVAPVLGGVAALWAQGALQEAWNVHILYNLRVYGPNPQFTKFPSTTPMGTRVLGVTNYLAQGKVAIVIPPALVGLAVLWRRDRTLAAAVGTWVAVGVGLVLLQNKYWLYHWGTVYAAAPLLTAIGLHAIWREAGERAGYGRALVQATAALALVLWSGLAVLDVRLAALYALGRKTEQQYDSHFTRDGELDPFDRERAAAYLRAHTPEGAPFAAWTLHAGLAFESGRPNVYRIHNKREMTKLAAHPVVQGYRREYLARFAALRPRYLAVDTLGDSSRALRTPDDALRREFPELAALVARDYRPEVRLGQITLYRRLGPTDPAGPAITPVATGAVPPR